MVDDRRARRKLGYAPRKTLDETISSIREAFKGSELPREHAAGDIDVRAAGEAARVNNIPTPRYAIEEHVRFLLRRRTERMRWGPGATSIRLRRYGTSGSQRANASTSSTPVLYPPSIVKAIICLSSCAACTARHRVGQLAQHSSRSTGIRCRRRSGTAEPG